MNWLKKLDKRLKLRWKLLVPLLLTIFIGVTITVFVTSYTTYKFAIFQAKENLLPHYYQTVKILLLEEMKEKDFVLEKSQILKKFPNVKIIKAKISQSEAQSYPQFTLKDDFMEGKYLLKAEEKCISCHRVKPGEVLGIVSIKIPMKKILQEVKRI